MIEIPSNSNWKKIGISLSGGADSAILSYLVLKNNPNAEIFFITQVRGWKTKPWQRYNALDVVAWFRKNFDHTMQHVEGFIPPDLEWGDKGANIVDEYGQLKSGDRIILRSHNEYICHRENIDAWFSAVTKNPTVHFEGGMDDRNTASIPKQHKHLGVDVLHPFIDTQKDTIIRLYQENSVQDLLKITRSCEGEFENLDYTNYMPGQDVPECGKCFWCKERQWGIDNA